MKKVGDLYWTQLSMWDFSEKEHISVSSDKGMHYELRLVTEVTSPTSWKARKVGVDELSPYEIEQLTPEKGNTWMGVMGNRVGLV